MDVITYPRRIPSYTKLVKWVSVSNIPELCYVQYIPRNIHTVCHFDGLVQDYSISRALAMEIL